MTLNCTTNITLGGAVAVYLPNDGGLCVILNVAGCSLPGSCSQPDYTVSCPYHDSITLMIHNTTTTDIGAWECIIQGTDGPVAITNLHQFGEC